MEEKSSGMMCRGQNQLFYCCRELWVQTSKTIDNMFWINYIKIITGGLAALKTENKLKPGSLVSTSYKKLVEELEDNYDVVTFPFDWRLPLEDSAIILNKKVKELMKHGQPIKMIGHSMGGVLIRDFIVLHKETWDILNNYNRI
jgi:triacylglycerol esterase/lipase EstA (alpha/beta hydrolase family)